MENNLCRRVDSLSIKQQQLMRGRRQTHSHDSFFDHVLDIKSEYACDQVSLMIEVMRQHGELRKNANLPCMMRERGPTTRLLPSARQRLLSLEALYMKVSG